MKKTSKRVLVILIALVLVIAGGAIFAYAETTTGTEGYYTYSKTLGKVTITAVDPSISGEVIIPDELADGTVTTIAASAFANCSEVKSLSVPDSIETIGKGAFYGMNGLTEITLPFVGESRDATYYNAVFGYIFDYVRDLSSSGTSGASDAFFNQSYGTIPDDATWQYTCKNSLYYSYGNPLYKYQSYYYFIPDSITRVTITDATKIDTAAFMNCTNITDISLNEGITSIGSYTFKGNVSLQNQSIPASVQSIGSYAFYGCSNLISTNIPNGISDINSYQYYGCTSLSEIDIPESVQTVGSYCFQNVTSITNLVIPNSVKAIGRGAFCGMTGLTEITLPFVGASRNATYFEAVFGFIFDYSVDYSTYSDYGSTQYFFDRSYGTVPENTTWQYTCRDISTSTSNYYKYRSFYYYIPSSLTKITITDATEVKVAAFMNCGNITEINLNDGISSVGSYAFKNDVGLTSQVIPESVQTIGASAFYGCENLITTNIPDGVTSINTYQYYDCSSLISIDIPDSVSDIGTYALSNCNSLSEIALPEGLKNIGSYALLNCVGITSITVPNSVETVGIGAFKGISGLTEITLPFVGASRNASYFEAVFGFIFDYSVDYSTYSDYGSTQSFFNRSYGTAPENTTWQYTCRDISSSTSNYYKYRSFYYYIPLNLSKITITDATKIEAAAFMNCVNITEISLNDGISSVGSCAFENCSAICQEGDVFYLGSYLINAKSSISGSYTVKEGTKVISSNAFNGCTKLTGITLADSVNIVCEKAFYGCSALTFAKLSTALTTINDYAFYNCSSLATLSIPTNVKTVGSYSFYGCKALSSINIPNSLETIKPYTFYGCSSLANIVIPDGIKSIEDCAFESCTGLLSIKTPESVSSIGGSAFLSCSNLLSIKIPESVTKIGADICRECTSLVSVTLPSGLEELPNNAFRNCSALSSVKMPTGLKSIGISAFDSCSSLKKITIADSVTSIGSSAFYRCSALQSITMPCSAKIYNIANTFANCSNIETFTLTKGTGVMQSYGTTSGTSDANTNYQFTPWYFSREKIASIIFEEGITNIGSYAFCDCVGLADVTLPSTVEIIGENAFKGCTGLSSLSLNQDLISIGNYAFDGCTSLEAVDVPNSVTSIGTNAFSNCTNLTSVKLSKNLSAITNSSFSGCTSLESIEIPEGVVSIGNNAFDGCSAMTSVVIDESVLSIGKSAFNGTVITDIYYTGSESDWEDVVIASGNDVLDSATLHTNYKPEHDHSYLPTETVDPTCTEKGYTIYSCSCGDSYKEYKNALGHDFGEWTTTTEATCTEAGEETRECSRCDATESQPIAAKGHSYNSVVTDPTCTEKGYTTYTCSACGNNYTDNEVDALGHDFSEWSTTKEATCTEAGEKTRGCSRCDATETEAIDALGHYFSEWTVTTAATCTENGEESRSCSRCEEKETREITAPGHDYKVVVTEPTCTAGGYTTHTCSGCGDSFVTDEINALGHDFSKWTYADADNHNRTCSRDGVTETEPHNYIVDTERSFDATEEAEGKRVYVCPVCGNEKTVTLPKLDHVHHYETTVVAPTCEEEGYTVYTCSTCKDTFTADRVNALGHAWNTGEVTKEATCTEEGIRTFTCQNDSSHTKTEPIPAKGHAYEAVITAPTCTEKGYTTYICTACGDHYTADETDATGHSFGAWTQTKAPTVYAEGEEQQTCSKCGEKNTKSIPKLPMPKVVIQHFTASSKAYDYRSSITFKADVDNKLPGGQIHWFVDGKEVATGDTYTAENVKQGFSLQAKYYVDSKEIPEAATDVEKVNVNTGFFAKLKAFFRGLFGLLPKVTQEYLGIEFIDRILPD